MIRSNFRTPKMDEIKKGLPVWLNGKSFEDTRNLSHDDGELQPVCGPFLVGRILFTGNTEPRVDIIDPESGRERSMLSSWLLIPKEE